MKRFLFAILCFFLFGAFLLEMIRSYPGYLLISVAGKRIEMNLWVGLVALLLAVLTIFFAIWLIRSIGKMLGTGFSSVKFGRRRVARRRMNNGLVEFMEGNWSRAKRHLLKSASRSEAPVINYLAAARSAFELGNRDEANRLLAKAEASPGDPALAVALSQARMQLAEKHYEQCIATLERAKQLEPKHPALLQMLMQSYLQLGDWQHLRELLPDLSKHGNLPPGELEALEFSIYRELLREAGARGNAEKLRSFWQGLSGRWTKNLELRSLYADLLHKAGEDVQAEKENRWILDKEWRDDRVTAYGLLTGADPAKQQTIAEGWLRDRPDNPALLTTLGRISLRNQLWGKARQYFDKSLLLRADATTSAELARLLEAMGEQQDSARQYRDGLMQAVQDLPDLPLPKA